MDRDVGRCQVADPRFVAFEMAKFLAALKLRLARGRTAPRHHGTKRKRCFKLGLSRPEYLGKSDHCPVCDSIDSIVSDLKLLCIYQLSRKITDFTFFCISKGCDRSMALRMLSSYPCRRKLTSSANVQPPHTGTFILASMTKDLAS